MTPIQKLAKLALEHPELRDDLVPILKQHQAGVYQFPKDNWVLLDLAVQDAHKGKPDREWYRKDEGYTEVYDRTVKELKRKGRRAYYGPDEDPAAHYAAQYAKEMADDVEAPLERALNREGWDFATVSAAVSRSDATLVNISISLHAGRGNVIQTGRGIMTVEAPFALNLSAAIEVEYGPNMRVTLKKNKYDDLESEVLPQDAKKAAKTLVGFYKQHLGAFLRGKPVKRGFLAAHRLTQRDIKDAILNNHAILKSLKADPSADQQWVAALEKQIEGLRLLLEQAEMKRPIQASGSGASNAEYLDGLPPHQKAKILKAVAKHYGVSVREIEGELKHPEAEDLYEYLAFDRGMAMQVYRDFQRRFASKWKDVTGPPTDAIYERKIDHGYDQPLSGGTDVMKRLQDQLLIEQGREPRPKNPRLAFCQAVQHELVAMLTRDAHGKVAADRVRTCVGQYMQETGETVLAEAVVNDIINEAVGVALDPQRVARIVARHSIKEEP